MLPSASIRVRPLRLAPLPRLGMELARPEIPLPRLAARPETGVMPGFTSTGNQALVSCLGDTQRAVAAYHELLRRRQ
jgi:hypothetical protein